MKTITALPILLLPFLLPYDTAAQNSADTMPWLLPLLFNSGPASNTNPVHSGTATYYTADGDGTCMFGPSPDDLMVTALNGGDFGNADYCGAYLRVTGPQNEITVRVVDSCPTCESGQLDLSAEAFAQIADLIQGTVPITWQVISPDITGPIAYHFHDSSNQWWLAVQIRNHRNPIARLEYLNGNDQWIDLPRTGYNYFEFTFSEPVPGPYTFRVTDWYGNLLTDSGIPLSAGGTIEGTAQFPVGP